MATLAKKLRKKIRQLGDLGNFLWLLWLKSSEKFRQLEDSWQFSVATLAKKLRKNFANLAILAIFCGYFGKKLRKNLANWRIWRFSVATVAKSQKKIRQLGDFLWLPWFKSSEKIPPTWRFWRFPVATLAKKALEKIT